MWKKCELEGGGCENAFIFKSACVCACMVANMIQIS